MFFLFVVLPAMCHLKRLRNSVVLMLFVAPMWLHAGGLSVRYDGAADGKGYILYLEQWHSFVSANLFTFDQDSADKIHASRVELTGKMTDEFSFLLKQNGSGQECLTGRFTDGDDSLTLSGSCLNGSVDVLFSRSAAAQQKLNFHRFTETSYIRQDGQVAWEASLEMDAILPENRENRLLSDALIGFASLPADNSGQTPFDSLMKMEGRRFSEQFRRMAANDNTTSNQNRLSDWQRVQLMQVVLSNEGLHCLEKTTYAYSGGANGLTNSSFLIVDDSGKTINWKDIIHADSIEALKTLMIHKLKQAFAVDSLAPLSKAGFFGNDLALNENNYLSHDGFAFVYNVYEIAPRSMGTIRVQLTPAEILPLAASELWHDKLMHIFYPQNLLEP